MFLAIAAAVAAAVAVVHVVVVLLLGGKLHLLGAVPEAGL